ncbi:MAG TPA: hypothetical protein VFS40_02615 [Gemmatimonadales bacterium]|nr:hypothetical protein [Gemmatimonadales bacterium]
MSTARVPRSAPVARLAAVLAAAALLLPAAAARAQVPAPAPALVPYAPRPADSSAALPTDSAARRARIPNAVRRASPAPIKYGKWALLAGSIGLNLLAAQAHDRADAAYDELKKRCAAANELCTTDPQSGRYLDARSEFLYQRSLTKDREARLWLFSGETALLGSAALFIWELSRPKHPPANIPFDPTVSVTGSGETRVGGSLRF